MANVRRATPDDAATFATLRARLWDDEHPDDPSDQDHWDRMHAHYAAAFVGARTRGFVIEDDGGVAGIVTLIVDEHTPRKRGSELRGYVTDMYVLERARRRGLARALMTEVISHARAAGLRRLVLRSTSAALPLYESVGFVPFKTFALLLDPET
jgi:GNAT superfamily N-acetyltransferase